MSICLIGDKYQKLFSVTMAQVLQDTLSTLPKHGRVFTLLGSISR